MSRKGNVTTFSRSYRRRKPFGMGLPPKKPRRRWRFPRIPLIGWAILVVFVIGIFPVVIDAAKGWLTPTDGCTVWQVLDGDTVRIWCSGRGTTSARIMGYDSPELFSPRCTSEWAWAVAATYFLRWQLWTALHITAIPQGVDRYDRMLVMLRTDGALVAPKMIDAGMGRPYDGGRRGGWC